MKKFVCILGILIGLVLSVSSGWFLVKSPNYLSVTYDVSKEYYGGDAYTGIQNATATTANNVEALAMCNDQGFRHLNTFAGALTLATGLGFILVSTYKLADNAEKKRQNKKALLAGNNGFSPAPTAYQTPVNNTAPDSGENQFSNQQ